MAQPVDTCNTYHTYERQLGTHVEFVRFLNWRLHESGKLQLRYGKVHAMQAE